MRKSVGHPEIRPRRQKWFIRVCLLCGALYFLLMIVVTVYSQTVYARQLPAVRLQNPREAEISYTLQTEAEITEDGAVILLDLSGVLFPSRVLQPGCPVTLQAEIRTLSGTVEQVTGHPDDFYELTLDLDSTGLTASTKARAELQCAPASFRSTADRSLIYQNTEGRDVIYLVVQQDGPWGKQYVLQEEEVVYWPPEGSETVALMLLKDLTYPIARPEDPQEPLYSGMEVHLIS